MKTSGSARSHLRLLLLASLVITVGVAALFYFAQVQMRRARAAWPKAPVRILAERTIVAQVYGEHRDNAIFYQGEVLADYVVNGRNMERWIPVFGTSTDKTGLERELQRMAKRNCYAQWNPDYAEEVSLAC